MKLSKLENEHFTDGYSLLFDMQSGRLIEVRKHEIGPDGRSELASPLSESRACGEDLFGTFSE